MSETFKGYIIRRLFKSNDSDFKIYLVEQEDGTQVRINGHLPDFSGDFLYEFTGDSYIHETYGKQYKITHFKKADKQSYLGLIHYLSSDLFTGIGPVKAKRIVDALGDEAIQKILNDKNVLREIGFNPIQTERLFRELFKNQNLEETLVALLGYGLTSNLAMRLYTAYGFNTLEVVEKNPYQLINQVAGIGFIRADEIASKMGIKKDDSRRVEAAILYTIDEYINREGDTYLNEVELYNVVYKKLLKDVNEEKIQNSFEKLIEEEKIIREKNKYTLYNIQKTELKIAKEIKRLLTETALKRDLSTEIEEVEKIFTISYTNQQKQAIETAMNNQLTIITGGPGTGKTTVLSGLLEVYSRVNGIDLHTDRVIDKVGLCAPTGRAARRMTEVMDIRAFTIHRLLGYDHTGNFSKDETDQLTQELLIIDEASMIDIYLAEQLFKAIPSSTKVIIVGDKDQLPSVGPGQVLGDLIGSEKIPIVYLDEIHRQSKNSSIVSLANKINSQTVDRNYSSSDDLLFMREHENAILKQLKIIVKAALEQGYDLIDDIQILIPIYRGPVGIDLVNETFQRFFLKEDTPFINLGTNRFYVGDKVIHQINNPTKGVMNGDIGYVKSIIETSDNKKIMRVNYIDVEVDYDLTELDELKLAYAISVHKSQGSEYQIVLMPLVRSYSHMLRKELLYTGVTRAKDYLYLIGDLSLIEIASKRLNKKRNTMLKEYLKEEQAQTEVTPFDFL